MFKVSIIGRPNVGKSTLFNRIVGKKKALTSHTPGLTRDINYAECSFNNKHFILTDTAGLEDIKTIDKHWIYKNVKTEIDQSDIVLFIVDGRECLNPIDKEIAKLILKTNKKFVLVVNKIDSKNRNFNVYDFYALGNNNPIPISATHGIGISNVINQITKNIPKTTKTSTKVDINVAIVGKPNVGKSSILNKILGEDRVLVDHIPGTTRDSIHTYISINDMHYCLIDTAGIRKKNKVKSKLERLIVEATETSISICDIAILVIDATDGINEQDAKISQIIAKHFRACLIVLNKWDLIEDKEYEIKKIIDYIKFKFPSLRFAPIISTSAKTNLRISSIFTQINKIYAEYTKIISQHEVTETILNLYAKRLPPINKYGKRLIIKSAIQEQTKPPTFQLRVNNTKYLTKNYMLYLKNKLRKIYKFEGAPIKISLKTSR